MGADDSQLKGWNFFRAGGVVQVEIKSADDLKKLDRLDPKHWMALAMPVQGVHFDPRTLSLLDTDQDGQIRPPEIISAVQWASGRVQDFAQFIEIKSEPSNQNIAQSDVDLPLVQLAAPELLQCAQRILKDLAEMGDTPNITQAAAIGSQRLSLSMVDKALQLFKDSPLNGDGVITLDAVHNSNIKQAIQWIIDTQGHVIDRSGKPGMTLEKIDSFFLELEARRTWLQDGARLFQGNSAQTSPLTSDSIKTIESLKKLYDAYTIVAQPIDDYFDLYQFSKLNPEIATKIQEPTPESHSLKSILQGTPLARVTNDGTLNLRGPLNPLWAKTVLFVMTESQRLGLRTDAQDRLTQNGWEILKAHLVQIGEWKGKRPQSQIDDLLDHEVINLLESQMKSELLELIRADLKKANDYEAHADLQKLLLLKRDLLRIVQNMVNFSDFYRQRNGIFQVGTLFIDGRSTELCLEQINPARHASLDPLSGAFVVYCDCTRAKHPPKSIIAIITGGEGSQMSAGRAGIFIDKQGNDWSALITKVIANPVSYREAFWSPYRRIVRWVEEQVSKKMAAADITAPSELSKVAEKIQPAAPVSDKPGEKPAQSGLPLKIDVGTVAALGVALGSIGTFIGVVTSKFFDLGILMPFGIIAVGLMISSPSVVLAWFKLKNRNLGPILDANGWAINTRAIINVPFASSLTSLRQVPISLGSIMPDPYAEKDRPWKVYWTLGALGFIFLLWLGGYLDRYLPEKARFNSLIDGQKPSITQPATLK